MELQIANGFQWLGIVLGSAGLGAIILAVINRYWLKKDESGEMHEMNQGKKIDADIIFKQSFIDRLSRVEDKLEKAEEKLNTSLAMNSEFKAENKILNETNIRQEAEITQLRDKEKELTLQLYTLTEVVAGLEKEITALQGKNESEDDPLKVKLVKNDKKME